MNHTELEDRLRSAYRARTDQVTAADLTHEPPAFDEPVAVSRAGRRPWLAPLLAAAAVVLLAAVALVVAHVANRTSQPADEPLRLTTPNVRSWSGVSPGWTIAMWVPKAAARQQTVFLVSPTGQRQAIATLPSGYDLDAVSDDNSHVAFIRGPGSGPFDVVVLDLRTRVQHRFSTPRGHLYIGFDTPDGSLSRVMVGTRTQLVDEAGRVRSVHGPSAVDEALDSADGSAMPVSINGQTAIVVTSRRIVVQTPEGKVLASLRLPGRNCRTTEPWNEQSLLVQCQAGIFAVPLDGGAPVRLARPAPGVGVGRTLTGSPYQLYDVVRVAGRTYGIEVPSCGGNDRISLVDGEGIARPVQENGAPVAGAITGHTDDAFYFVKVNGCRTPAGTLYRYTPGDHKIVALLGGTGHGGGVVLGAFTIEAAGPGGHRLAF